MSLRKSAAVLKGAVAITLGFVAMNTTYARLGETEAQLVNRYGEATLRSPESVIEQGKIYSLADNLIFRADNWTIIARLVNGRCESITYAKAGEWTEDQYRVLLDANGTRAQWEERKTPTPETHRTWKRRDGATAEWRSLQGITLESPSYPKAREALKKRAKEETSKLPKV